MWLFVAKDRFIFVYSVLYECKGAKMEKNIRKQQIKGLWQRYEGFILVLYVCYL